MPPAFVAGAHRSRGALGCCDAGKPGTKAHSPSGLLSAMEMCLLKLLNFSVYEGFEPAN